MTQEEQETPKPGTVPFPPRNAWKAAVLDEGESVLKDYGGAPFVPRILGRISLHCEQVALQLLEGVKGLPAFLGRPGPYSLRMGKVPGRPLAKLRPGELSETCFARLKGLVQEIHDRGVAHGDLHLRNILIHGEEPYLIDFSTAYVRGRLPLVDGWVFRRFCLLDLERIYKVEKRFFSRGERPRMFLLYRMVKGLKG